MMNARRTRTTLAGIAATGILGSAFAAAPHASADPTPKPAEPPAWLTELVQPQRPDLSPTDTRRSAPQEGRGGDTSADVQATLDAAVAQGAVGVTARVDSPKFTGRWAAGTRSIDKRTKATPNAPFRVASNTKSHVATAALQLVEEGTWTLDTTVDDILPGLVPGHGDVTLEQLLSHTSGMPDGLTTLLLSRVEDPNATEEAFAALGEDYTDADIIAAMNSDDWLFEPGTDFAYSNAGYVVVGAMIEEATGRPMEKVLSTNVFRPAHMGHTWFATAPGLPGNALVDTAVLEGKQWSLAHFNPAFFSSAGATVSSTKGLNSFNDALFDGDLLEPSTVSDMVRERSAGTGYGLGVYSIPDPCTPAGQPTQYLYGHDGASYGTLSYSFGSPDGTRQYSLGVTGRHLDNPTGAQPYDLNAILAALIAPTC